MEGLARWGLCPFCRLNVDYCFEEAKALGRMLLVTELGLVELLVQTNSSESRRVWKSLAQRVGGCQPHSLLCLLSANRSKGQKSQLNPAVVTLLELQACAGGKAAWQSGMGGSKLLQRRGKGGL